jgi:TorA maturation chaperone TorD
VPERAAPIELLRGLAVLAEPPEPVHARVVEALGLPAAPTPSEYSDVFLFQLYPYASVHLGAEGMLGGEARDRVAGFWRALGLVPPAEPDHLAALVGLYASLAEREEDAHGAECALIRQSRRALLEEHLAPWVFPFLARCGELTVGVFGSWANMLASVLKSEWMRRQPGDDRLGVALPAHLREAPPLPDPRQEGAEAFLGGLLAPVRSGMVLTRADLARVAAEAEVGLRAGERRYALEHLLAQDAPAVLDTLATEAARQGRAHRQRVAWLGASATFLADRAETTAALLRDVGVLATVPAS